MEVVGMQNTIYEINLNAEGDLPLPEALREALGLQADDAVKVVHTSDHLLLIPKRLLVSEFADYMSKLLAEKGLTLNDVLESGATIRAELFAERYGDLSASLSVAITCFSRRECNHRRDWLTT